MYNRPILNHIHKRFSGPRHFLQILSGPRQTGKTFIAQQLLKMLDWPGHYATADEPALKGAAWIEQQWEVIRTRIKTDQGARKGVLVLNTGLMTATGRRSFEETRNNPELWGRLVETAVSASLFNATIGKNIDLYYWAARNRELDIVLSREDELIAIEVKSTARKTNLPGIEAFSKQLPVARKLMVGTRGIPLEEFLLIPVEELF